MKRLLIICCLIQLGYNAFAKHIEAVYLRSEYKESPFLDIQKPRLSWELTSKITNQHQSAYQILVASSAQLLNKNVGDLWDSKKVISNATSQVEYAGKTLKSGQQVYWKIRVWDASDQVGKWSDIANWEMAIIHQNEWQAKWIGADLNSLAKPGEYHLPPSPYIRKEINLPAKKITAARLHISSLGLHEFYINGQKIGKDYFASGWSDYDKRVYYNTYDVTKNLSKGTNIFGAILSEGWYAGYLGYAILVGSKQVKHYYGDVPLLKAEVHITYSDGTKDVVVTDKSWKTATSPIVESDLLQGEYYDATKELTGWNTKNFDASTWKAIEEYPEKEGRLVQYYPGNPVQVFQELPAKSVTKIKGDKYIVDFGQNFAGIVRLKVKGKRGDKIIIRYGEMLHTDGTLMTENLRKARVIDTYVLKGDPAGEVWSPKFTFHGFQYVEISGLSEAPTNDVLTGLAMTSSIREVGKVHTDNAMLNQLVSNIIWTQRANYLDVPTDCPQRDERLGWTGDAQVYMRSAIYNADVTSFHSKWIRDLNDGQWPDGAYPIYAPIPKGKDGKASIRSVDSFSPGWSDAGVICAYEFYKAYGDTRIIEESFPYMEKYISWLNKQAKGTYLIKENTFPEIGGGFGDWLSVGLQTGPDLLATMYYFYCSKLVAELASAIGEHEKAKSYIDLSNKIKNAVEVHYISMDGKFKVNAAAYSSDSPKFAGHTQTAYANAIYMEILSEEDLTLAGKYLSDLVEQNDNKLSTGFLGFKPLLPALSKTGSSDKAYQLLLSEEYPSLGYEVKNGATSIWERWDSYIQGTGFIHNAAMNSFSHYAFGSVNEWMFENMLGIKALKPGFSQFQIKPEIPTDANSIKTVNGEYHSIAGLIKSGWDYSKAEKVHTLEIPVNTTCYFYLDAPSLEQVFINGEAAIKSKLILALEKHKGQHKFKLGSGVYKIVIKE